MTKILIVEDDTNLREIYAVRLEAEGYTVVEAADGEEGLSKATQEKPDLILSDVMMPRISGFDMLDILRATPETANLKVIMLTALGDEDQRSRGEGLGADRYIVKSQAGIDDIVVAIKEVLGEGSGTASATPETAPLAHATPEVPAVAPAEPAPTVASAEPVAPAMPAVEPEPAPAEPVAPVEPVSEPAPAPIENPAPVEVPVTETPVSIEPIAPVVEEPMATPTPVEPSGDISDQIANALAEAEPAPAPEAPVVDNGQPPIAPTQ